VSNNPRQQSRTTDKAFLLVAPSFRSRNTLVCVISEIWSPSRLSASILLNHKLNQLSLMFHSKIKTNEIFLTKKEYYPQQQNKTSPARTQKEKSIWYNPQGTPQTRL
jgi:hypothetical protein